MSDVEDGGAPSAAEEIRASEIRALELKLQIALAEKAAWETRAEVAGRSAASLGEPGGGAVAKVYLLPREFTDVSTAGLFPLDGEGAKGAPQVLALTYGCEAATPRSQTRSGRVYGACAVHGAGGPVSPLQSAVAIRCDGSPPGMGGPRPAQRPGSEGPAVVGPVT